MHGSGRIFIEFYVVCICECVGFRIVVIGKVVNKVICVQAKNNQLFMSDLRVMKPSRWDYCYLFRRGGRKQWLAAHYLRNSCATCAFLIFIGRGYSLETHILHTFAHYLLEM